MVFGSQTLTARWWRPSTADAGSDYPDR